MAALHNMQPSTNNPTWQLQHTYASLPEAFYRLQHPVPVAKPQIVCFNQPLANNLGLNFLNAEHQTTAAYLSGNTLPEGAKPLAQAYAGHQFGHFTMLGDGRAILLGEQLTPNGNRFDIQFKGSGRTPYSRGGDGRATLYSMLREYLISEAMHHLGIPTTRSLAVVSTGEQVFREEVHQGAVLTRVAASHLRVGTFEYARHFGSKDDLQALANYTIQRHYPELAERDNPALELLKAVMHQQIDLVVHWMRVGFIHGVMNTDNTSIAGESIDYGPCAFMNGYSRKTVFSSIDTQGRYAYGNQPRMVHWNIMAFANALLPLFAETPEKAVELGQEVIDGFQLKFNQRWYAMMLGKLGIVHAEEEDKALVDRLLAMMEAHQADYTQLFVALQHDKEPHSTLFQLDEFKSWRQQWKSAQQRGAGEKQGLERMKQLNPRVIPRNHWVEQALEAVVAGDLNPFTDLLNTLSKPYDDQPDELQFQAIPVDFDAGYQTFCGT